jgi:hypothetical protein
MKRQKLVIVTLILAILLLGMIVTVFDLKYEKTLKFRDYEVAYDQYIKGRKKLYDGHYLENKDLEDQAYMILINKLLDDYLKNQDDTLKYDILKISNEHNLIRGQEITSIDTLVSNRIVFLDTLISID